VEVSRDRIAQNYRALKAAAPGVEIMPVVKADAYRHGAVEVSRVLEREGVRWLAVSSVDEGCALREAGIAARILVMSDFLPSERKGLLEYRLTPAIHSLDDIRALNEISAQRGTPTEYHLKIDSGMGRLGTRSEPDEIARAVQANPWATLEARRPAPRWRGSPLSATRWPKWACVQPTSTCRARSRSPTAAAPRGAT
jgi:alanine racemase